MTNDDLAKLCAFIDSRIAAAKANAPEPGIASKVAGVVKSVAASWTARLAGATALLPWLLDQPEVAQVISAVGQKSAISAGALGVVARVAYRLIQERTSASLSDRSASRA